MALQESIHEIFGKSIQRKLLYIERRHRRRRNSYVFLYELKAKPTPFKRFRFLYILGCLKKFSIWSFVHICHSILLIKVHFSRLLWHQASTKETERSRKRWTTKWERLYGISNEIKMHSSFVCITEWNENGIETNENKHRILQQWMNERTNDKIEENETTWMKLWNAKCKMVDGMGMGGKKNLDYYTNGMLCSL